MAPQARKRTQRERLLKGMVEVANRRGYAGASVSAVIAEAGVSRPTFYDYFADRDECFTAAIVEVQQALAAQVEGALEGCPAERAACAAIEAMLAFADVNAPQARFLTAESMSGGRMAMDARDQGIAAIATLIDMAQQGARSRARLGDLEHRVLVGSVYRLIATRLRRGESSLASLAPELLEWVSAYEVAVSSRRWGELRPERVPGSSPHVPRMPIQQMPSVYPPGRPRVSEAEISENHRFRILYAAARLAESKGYTATTVGDITRFARVDGRVFYRLFSDKQDAFTAVHELGFQQVMDVTSKAFFAAEGWPQRSWEAGRALTQLLQANPLVANVGFVEAYAVGPGAVQRIEDSHTAFVFFLQEGLVYRPMENPPSRVAMEAIIASIFEVIYLQARNGEQLQVAGMLPYIAHLWLTPFMGPAEANRFIDSQRSSKPKRGRKAKS